LVVIEGFSHANMDERGTESESANNSDNAEICYATGDFTALEDNQVRISVRCMPVAGLSGRKNVWTLQFGCTDTSIQNSRDTPTARIMIWLCGGVGWMTPCKFFFSWMYCAATRRVHINTWFVNVTIFQLFQYSPF